MDEQIDEEKNRLSPFKRSSRMQLDGCQSVRSLQRDSSFFDECQLGHQNMAYVMSIQSDRKSDIYDRIMFIQQKRRSSNARNSSNNQKTGNLKHHNHADNRCRVDSQYVRKSGVDKKTFHSCCCDDQCQEVHCPCFSSSAQICMRGICCENCVRYKQALLNKNKGCYCKNSKCLKLFCKCFVNDTSCGQQCKCQGCQNTQDRYQTKKKKKKVGFQNQQINQKQKVQQKYSRIPQIAVNLTCCSCRKTHCLKKYCSCYFNNKKCGKFCICQKCLNIGVDYNQGKDFQNQQQRQQYNQNKGRYGRMQEDMQQQEATNKQQDIEKYFEQQNDNQDDKTMPKQMKFQPVDFNNMFERMRIDDKRR